MKGARAEKSLHESILDFVSSDTTFDDLFEFANSEIGRLGFENLDFLGNVGHSIESRREARLYVESGNQKLLIDSGLFTFEPHIKAKGSPWGFKHENIYYFNAEGRLAEL